MSGVFHVTPTIDLMFYPQVQLSKPTTTCTHMCQGDKMDHIQRFCGSRIGLGLEENTDNTVNAPANGGDDSFLPEKRLTSCVESFFYFS